MNGAHLLRVSRALVWESWMLLRWPILMRFGISLAFVALITAIGISVEDTPDTERMGVKVSILFIGMISLLSGLTLGLTREGKPGFPFVLGYTSPAPTWLIVSVPMLFRSVTTTLLYFVPVFAGHLYWEIPTVGLWGALLVFPIALLSVTSAWWTSQTGAVRLIGYVVVYFSACMLAYYGLHFHQESMADEDWWWTFRFTPFDWALMVAVCAFAITFCHYGVDRQRRSEPLFASTDQNDQGDWIMSLFETRCPTTSPRRAELWGEIQGRGLPVLVYSSLAALSIPMLWFITVLLDSMNLWFVVSYGVMLIPLAKGTPSFGVRIKEGVAALSLFDATRPLSTAWLTFTKSVVAVVSINLGVLVLLVSFWFSAPLVEYHINFLAPLQDVARSYVTNTSAQEVAAQALVLFFQFATMVIALAVMQTGYAVYANRLTMGLLFAIVYVSALVIAVASKGLPVEVGLAHLWGLFIIVAGATIYCTLSLMRNNVLTASQMALLGGIWLIYVIAYMYTLSDAGLFDGDTPPAFLAFRASVCLLTLLVFASAPWTFDRARHG